MALMDAYNFNGLPLELHGQFSSVDPHPHLAMNVPGHLRILGGGAVVETTGQGSLLTSCYPISGTEWDAKAKDHQVPSPGRVFACCIAAEIPPAQYTIVSSTTPAPANHPTAEAILPPDFVLVGGGARANWEQTGGAGSLLYASRPGAGESWFAAAKDHFIPNPTTVTAFAIGVARSYLGSLGLTVIRVRANSVVPAADPMVRCGMDDARRAALIAGGAEVHWTGAGNLLTVNCADAELPGSPPPKSHPYGWRAHGKDHQASDPAPITAWGLVLYKY